ncbi:MAG: hypothetical protein M3R02_30750 [Chloroflexota bacterium]|nr:hypothetical protein [Chloroflexota bacterium]
MEERDSAGKATVPTPGTPAAPVQLDPLAGQAEPADVPAPMASGGIGGVNDGTQVNHHSPTPVPGKPMAPIATDPAGNDTLEGQAMDPPAGSAHAERGGSG